MGRVDSEAEAAVLDDARGVALRHLGVKGHLSLRLRRRVKREIDRIERRPERERRRIRNGLMFHRLSKGALETETEYHRRS